MVSDVFLIPYVNKENAKNGAIQPPMCVPVIENAIANDLCFLNHRFINVIMGSQPDNAEPKLTKKYAKISDVLNEWNIKSEPYTFLIKNKKLVSKFQGYVSYEEIDNDIDKILDVN